MGPQLLVDKAIKIIVLHLPALLGEGGEGSTPGCNAVNFVACSTWQIKRLPLARCGLKLPVVVTWVQSTLP